MTPSLKQSIRKRLLTRRRQLSPEYQAQSSAKVIHHLGLTQEYRQARRIAFYMSAHGEIDLKALMLKALSHNKLVYLPCISRTQSNGLTFVKVESDTRLSLNRYGIWEPLRATPCVKAYELDLVLTPLVGADKLGHRLGMGKGYYDRCFAFKQPGAAPLLMGIGYDFQLLNAVPHSSRDVDLDAIITPCGIRRF